MPVLCGWQFCYCSVKTNKRISNVEDSKSIGNVGAVLVVPPPVVPDFAEKLYQNNKRSL
jgi:hypothetical protein